MLRLIRRVADVVETVATIGGVILLVVVAGLAGTEIVARSAFGSSSLIVVDLSLQLAILMYFIGYPALLNGDRDIRMDYLYLRFPAKARRLIDVATSLAVVGFFGLLLSKSIVLFEFGLRFRHPVFPMPNAIVIAPVVAGAALGLIVAIRKAVDSVAALAAPPLPDERNLSRQ